VPLPTVDGADIRQGSIPADRLMEPFVPPQMGRSGGGGVDIRTDLTSKPARVWFDTTNHVLMVTYDGVDYTIGP
jgi:hypothetical protein